MLSKMWCRSSVRGGRVQAMASSVDARESPQSGVKVVQPRQVAREETASQMTIDESKLTECVLFSQQRSLACPVSEVVGVHVHLYFCVRRGLQPRLRIHSHAALQNCLYVWFDGFSVVELPRRGFCLRQWNSISMSSTRKPVPAWTFTSDI